MSYLKTLFFSFGGGERSRTGVAEGLGTFRATVFSVWINSRNFSGGLGKIDPTHGAFDALELIK